MHKQDCGTCAPGPMPSAQPTVMGALGVALQGALLDFMTASWHRDAMLDPVPPQLRRDVCG